MGKVGVTSSAVNRLIWDGNCSAFVVPRGRIMYAVGDGVARNLTLERALFYLIGCDNETISTYSTSQYWSQPIIHGHFSGSMAPTLASITACFLLSWVLFVSGVLLGWTRPWLYKLAITYNAVYLSVLFSTLHNHNVAQHALGYENVFQWVEDYFYNGRVIAFFLAFTLQSTIHIYTLARLFRGLQRWLGIALTSCLSITELILWILASLDQNIFSDNDTLCTAFKGWLIVQLVHQFFFLLFIVRALVGKMSLALAKKNWGLIVLTSIGNLSVFALIIATLVANMIWIWAMCLSLVIRLWTYAVFWVWSENIDNMTSELLRKGKMGKQIRRKNDADAYAGELGDDGLGYGAINRTPRSRVDRFFDWITSPHSISVRGFSIRGVETRSENYDFDPHGFGNVDSSAVEDVTVGGNRTVEVDDSIYGRESAPGYSMGEAHSVEGRVVVNHNTVHRRVRIAAPATIPDLVSSGAEGSSHSITIEDFDQSTLTNTEHSHLNEGAGHTNSPTARHGVTNSQPPPFQPQPGFSSGDYWDEKNRRHL